MSHRRGETSGRNASVLAFSGALVAAAALGFAGLVGREPVPRGAFMIPWIVFVVAFVASDNFAIHVEFGDNAHSFTLNELPLVVGLFACDPHMLVVARVVGAVIALTAFQRQRVLKLVFNVSMAALESVLVVGVFGLVGRGFAGSTALLWLVAVASTAIVNVMQAFAISAVVQMSGGRPERRQVVLTACLAMLSAGATACLGIATVTMLDTDALAGTIVMAVIAAVLFAAYRGYAMISQRYANLEKLYSFTKLLARSPEFETAMRVILHEATELLRAEQGELCLLDAGDGAARFIEVVYVDGQLKVSVGERFDRDFARARVLAADRGTMMVRHTRDLAERRYLTARGLRDVAIVPLRNGERVVGTLAVFNRRGEVSTFDRDDLKVFATLANHASVSLDNARLIDQLRNEVSEKQHQALHDPLTELGNRNLLTVRAEEALAERRTSGRQLAVLMMDLNRFKEVNDTLGHAQGDALLRQVAARLRQHAPTTATIARLGGDEFAVLLPRVGRIDEATTIAFALATAMQEPFVIDDLHLAVSAAVGVAVAPDHGDDIAALLQHADIAMYHAKEHGEPGVEVYDTQQNRHSQRQLMLAAELREAIEKDALAVYYQPKATLATGTIVGVEALARWEHPVHGPVPPEEFVPLAETTGLMREMTLLVLRRTLKQLAAWHRIGLTELHASVNLSARSLMSRALVDDVADALRQAGVPAESLTLEITETQMMADAARTMDVLQRLHDLGVRLSIDDFGTGYSSLSYLRSLPVDELKIDKSFVLDMNPVDANIKIVRSVVDLGRNLGLSVVAEGIEDAVTWETLAALGCDIGQGYYLSRPVPADRLTPWLLTRRDRSKVPAAVD